MQDAVRAEMMLEVLVCLVIAATDGDTLRVRCEQDLSIHGVRLADIDAPEKRQPFGAQSKASLGALCEGKTATLKTHGLDKYGRTIAYAECDGIDASEWQIKTGMAWVYVKYNKNDELTQVEHQARDQKAGLWSAEEPTAPWQFRCSRMYKQRGM